jgi:hypothetical protein
VSITVLRRLPPLPLFILLLAGILAVLDLSPSECSLGTNVRIVYLRGAWAWTALAAFAASGFLGLGGLLSGRQTHHRWLGAMAQTGAFFWVPYVPLTPMAMQANSNGLFLDERRWRLALNFSVVAVLLQLGPLSLDHLRFSRAMDLMFMLALGFGLLTTREVMHPASPIFSSPSMAIRAFFTALLGLCWLAGWQLARCFHVLAVSGDR